MHNEICGSLADKTTANRFSQSALPRRGSARTTLLEDALIWFFDAVLSWRDRTRSRYDLGQLDDRMLSDIGISRATAEQEASMPRWR